MAINAYIGIPGSGKTYEVVHSVILPAYLSGRRVVTNIEGIEEIKFQQYVENQNAAKKENSHIELCQLGKIIKVTDDDVLQDNFFPYKGSNDLDTVAKNGDLICIDEVWRIFDESKKLSEKHRSFLSEHRHFTNDNGQTSDLVVISQSVAQIPRFIRDRIENTYKMTKLKALGLSKNYRIDVYSGSKTFKSNLIHSILSKYNPQIFSLYKSYDKDNAKEKAIDERGNMLKSGWFRLKMISAILCVLGGCVYLYFSYQNATQPQPTISENASKVEQSSRQSSTKRANRAEKDSHINIQREKKTVPQEDSSSAEISSTWRIVGYLNKKGNKLVILSDGNYVRYELADKFKNHGNLLSGEIDGQKVTVYSGSHRKNNLKLGVFNDEK